MLHNLVLTIELMLCRDEEDGGSQDEESSSSSTDDDEVARERSAKTNENTQDNSADAGGMKSIISISATSPEGLPLDRIETNAEVDSSDSWHVFSLMATDAVQVNNASQTSLNSTTIPFDDRLLEDDMNEIDIYLSLTNNRPGESEAYKNCNPKTIEEIQEYISSLAGDSNDPKHIKHHRIQLVRSARQILSFFFPPKVDHIIIGKYWGAVYRILKDDIVTNSQSRFHHLVRNLHGLAHLVRDLKDELFRKQNPTHNQTNVPHEFIQAFLMCNMYFILFTTDQADRSRKYLRRCRALLTQGKLKIIQRLQTVTLRDREAVSPLGIATQLIGQLLQDVRGGPLFPERHQLASQYWEYLQTLV
jgi:hypothetical protein